MAGHNKWAQIKRQKGKTDAEKSKAFTKFARLISVEAKKAHGDVNSSGLKTAIERARAENMPNDSIERAIKKATDQSATMENITYEAYGPGGVAMIIEVLTDNRNKASQEIRHILTRNGQELAAIGSATWAFEKSAFGAGAGGASWTPKTTVELSDAEIQTLQQIVSELESNDDVQVVFTNAE